MRFLSPEWIAALDAAGRQADVPGDAQLVVQQVVERPDGQPVRYHLVVADRTVRVRLGQAGRADVTLTQSYPVAAALAQGELNAQAAIVEGRLRLSGDLDALARHGRVLAGLGDVFARVRRDTSY